MTFLPKSAYLFVLCCSFGASVLLANSRTVDFAGRKAEGVQQQRFDKKLWSQPGGKSGTQLKKKSFHIQEWNKHYSSMGSKRSSIAVAEKNEKKLFKTDIIQKKEVTREMSGWNQRMADLHKKAGIRMDDRARIAADRKLYHMMLQDTQAYADLGEELSLRELNRFQFRRNRSDGEVPVQRAGEGQ